MSATATASATTTFAPADIRMASLRAIYIIWYRDILRYWRDRWRLVASLAQPLLFLIVFGSGLGSALGRGTVFGAAGGVRYIPFLFSGLARVVLNPPHPKRQHPHSHPAHITLFVLCLSPT